MDKKKLNNEIILCRPSVRKARVAVIRKFIKKMKILKSCKIEALKEKKMKKSQRLFEMVQIMKKLKDDEVTKFALYHENLTEFLKKFPSDLKQKALVSLAKHDAVYKKVSNIRNQIPEWKTELPLLLDSLGRKKSVKINSNKKFKKIEPKKLETVFGTPVIDVQTEKVPLPVEKTDLEFSKVNLVDKPKTNIKAIGKESKINVENNEVCKNKDVKINEVLFKKVEIKEEKIDDPFFIEKKMIVPKLCNQTLERDSLKKPGKIKFQKDEFSYMFHNKPCAKNKTRDFNTINNKNLTIDQEKLHPSWLAKKVSLIKPFEGKKIVFSDE